jgi:hypothetical protein
MLAQMQKESVKTTGTIPEVEELKSAIDALSRGSQEGEDAKELLDTLFGGLKDAELVLDADYNAHEKMVIVTLVSPAVGELATKSKVPYQAQLKQTVTAKVIKREPGQVEEASEGRLELEMTGLYFGPPEDTKELFLAAMSHQAEYANDKKKCKKEYESMQTECETNDTSDECGKEAVGFESCVAYEWYKVNSGTIAGLSGKMARVLTGTPFGTKALSVEKEQGAWRPSLVGDKNRRRIIYSMLAAAPARFDRFIFGSIPQDFFAPAKTLDHKGKEQDTYEVGRYVAAISVEDFNGNDDLRQHFADKKLATKSLIIGKASLIGRYGTTYDYPLDMAESLGQGSSGINFARMVSAANPILQGEGIYVRPANPAKVMKMVGLCKEAFLDNDKIDTGCKNAEGRILWRAAATTTTTTTVA